MLRVDNMNMTNMTELIEVAQQFNMTTIDVFSATAKYNEIAGTAGLTLGFLFLIGFIVIVSMIISKYNDTDDTNELMSNTFIGLVILFFIFFILLGIYDFAIQLYAPDYTTLKGFIG